MIAEGVTRSMCFAKSGFIIVPASLFIQLDSLSPEPFVSRSFFPAGHFQSRKQREREEPIRAPPDPLFPDDLNRYGLRFTLAVFVVPLAAAVSVTAVLTVTGLVAIVMVPVDEPAGMVMLAGAGIAAELLEKVTVTGLVGVTARVMVPVILCPPMIVVGLSAKERMLTGFTLRVALLVVPLNEATMATGVVEFTE